MAASPEYIEQYALAFAAVFYVSDIIAVLEAGLQIFMCVYGLSSFLDTPPERRKGRLPYVFLSFLILFLSVIPTGIDLSATFKALYYTGPGLEYIRGRNSSASEGTEIASHCLFLSYVALGDALLLYRCYIIWNHMWYIIIPQILMFLGFLGLSIGNVGRFVAGTTRSSEDEALKSQRISTAYTSLTVGVNVIATALIAFRIIRAQQAIRRSLPARNMGMYNTAARIIIESALPLAIFGLITVILNIVNWGSDSATDSLTYSTVASIFSSLYASFAALSPQMIIFRVTTGRSHTHYGDLQYSINPATRPLEPIAFGDGHTGHSTDSLSSRLEAGPGVTVSNEKV